MVKISIVIAKTRAEALAQALHRGLDVVDERAFQKAEAEVLDPLDSDEALYVEGPGYLVLGVANVD